MKRGLAVGATGRRTGSLNRQPGQPHIRMSDSTCKGLSNSSRGALAKGGCVLGDFHLPAGGKGRPSVHERDKILGLELLA